MSSYLQHFVNFPIMWPILPSNLARNLAQSWQANARYCLPLICKITIPALWFITACSFVRGYKSFVLLILKKGEADVSSGNLVTTHVATSTRCLNYKTTVRNIS